MLSPAPLVDAFVAALKSIPALVTAMNGNASNIYATHYVFGSDQSLIREIYAMKAPSILVAWEGAVGGNFGAAAIVKDKIAVYIRAANQAGASQPVSYEKLWSIINNSPVNGGSQNLRYAEIQPGLWMIPETPSVEHVVDSESLDRFCGHYVFPQWGDQTN